MSSRASSKQWQEFAVSDLASRWNYRPAWTQQKRKQLLRRYLRFSCRRNACSRCNIKSGNCLPSFYLTEKPVRDERREGSWQQDVSRPSSAALLVPCTSWLKDTWEKTRLLNQIASRSTVITCYCAAFYCGDLGSKRGREVRRKKMQGGKART